MGLLRLPLALARRIASSSKLQSGAANCHGQIAASSLLSLVVFADGL
jgi:hypothetical protein